MNMKAAPSQQRQVFFLWEYIEKLQEFIQHFCIDDRNSLRLNGSDGGCGWQINGLLNQIHPTTKRKWSIIFVKSIKTVSPNSINIRTNIISSHIYWREISYLVHYFHNLSIIFYSFFIWTRVICGRKIYKCSMDEKKRRYNIDIVIKRKKITKQHS
jgi:hypothetical protein